MLLSDILEIHKNSDKIAVKQGNQTLTYRQLYVFSLFNASKLIKLKKRGNVGIFLPNSIDYIIAYFSILLCYCTVVPYEIQLKTDELLNTIKYCETEVIITDAKHKALLLEKLGQDCPVKIYELKKNEEYNPDNFKKMKIRITKMMLH